MADDAVFAVAQHERRCVATENIADFSGIADEADQRGQAHYGLLLIDPGKYPRGQQRMIGRLVTELDQLLKSHSSDEPSSERLWL